MDFLIILFVFVFPLFSIVLTIYNLLNYVKLVKFLKKNDIEIP